MKNFTLHKGWIHVIAWSVAFIILVAIIYSHAGNLSGVMLRTSFLFLTMGLVFYINLLVLLPHLLEKRRYLIYAVSVLALMFVVIALVRIAEPFFIPNHVVEEREHIMKGMSKEGRKFFHRGPQIVHGLSMFGILFMSTLVRNVSQRRKKELEQADLENKMLEAESKMLKSQLNPHFLFNSLNNIYALATVKSEKTPESIHELSQMLRYVLYDSDTNKVPLSKEVEYIESFVQLQLLKDDSLDNIKVNLDKVNGQLLISPLILISFIENCFKHSNFEDASKGWININIETQGNILVFEASNSKIEGQKKDSVGGVGLENVKRRLELAYPNKHELKIDDQEGEFHVLLNLKLDEN